MRRRATAGLLAVLALTSPRADASELGTAGQVAVETRWFPQSPARPGQMDGLQSSVVLRPEWRYRSDRGRWRATLIPHLRLDGRDDERTHGDLREAWWSIPRGDLELLAGVNTVFWGVAESRHLVDVINQTDTVEDIDGEDKLGQPMVRLDWQQDWGRVQGYALIGFREASWPGPEGRLGLPAPSLDDARYPDGRGDVDLAARYSHYFGDYDLGVHVFRGTNREASFEAVGVDGGFVLRPVYRRISQLGVDAQRTSGAWLWKFEGLLREGDGSTFAATVAGFEYTLYQIGGSAGDLGLLGEVLYDGRDESAAVTPYDRDVFVGTRLALNDVSDTTALVGVVADLRDGSMVGRVEVERRVSESLKLEIEGRWFGAVDPQNALKGMEKDGYLRVGAIIGL